MPPLVIYKQTTAGLNMDVANGIALKLLPCRFIAPNLQQAADDVSPETFVNFYCDGTQGLYIHAGVWHEAIFPMDEQASFLDRQGKVHARIGCNLDSEFGT